VGNSPVSFTNKFTQKSHSNKPRIKFTTVLLLLTFALSCVLSSPAPPKTRPKNEKEVAKLSLSQAAGHIRQLATKPDNSDKNDDPRLMRDLARRIEKLEKEGRK
jgi:hypothetical protein